MKKIISSVLILMSLLALLSICVYAQDSVLISLSEERGFIGTSVDVTLSVSENSELGNGKFIITYDRTKLSLDGFESGEYGLCMYADNHSDITVGFASAQSVVENAVLCTITFRILDAADASNPINIEVAECVNGETDDPIDASVKNGTIIAKPVPTELPGKQSAPTIVKVTSNSALISWADDISAYSYMLYVNGAPVSETPIENCEYTITGLNADTAYNVTLTATNPIGTSEQSDVAFFTTISFLKGDVDGNSKVELSDAMKAFQHVAKKIVLIDNQFLAADIDGNGKIELNDAMKIFQFVAKKISVLG